MSILPLDADSSKSSSLEAPYPNPSRPNHGRLFQSSHQFPTFGSLQISDSSESLHTSEVSGPLVSADAESSESSKKVIDVGTPSGRRNSPHNSTKHGLYHSAHRGVGHAAAQSRGQWAASNGSPQGQETSGPVRAHGSVPHSSGKKAQVTSGNHLLNFRYDPIVRSQPRAPPPPRRLQKRKPYNKDLFLQANFRFVVLDSGNYTPELMDPDKMLQWEDIICVKYLTPHPVQCPICLEYPLCPQITSCGHIFCFPCILHYLSVGQEDHKGDCWKKCPLCFIMICSKDLYTIDIEHVKHYAIGDTIEFMLLTRGKDSNILSQKHKQEAQSDEVCDLFSKFTYTSDVDLSVRKAISELDNWVARADSGLVDDLGNLPYVSAALEQLEQRKTYWNEHKDNSSNKADIHIGGGGAGVTVPCIDYQNEAQCDSVVESLDERASLYQTDDMENSLEWRNEVLSYPYDEKKCSQRHTNGTRDLSDKDLYNFYQAVDGQHFILHPLNMKCLLHHYGSYDLLPNRIAGKIIQLETLTQSEAMRKRYRYLSHFSLTTNFQLCEIDLGGMLPPESLLPFMDEIKKREKQRKRLAKKEEVEKNKAEAAIAHSMSIHYNVGEPSFHNPPEFSLDDFQALGNPAVASSSPPNFVERRLFSNVAKLGFAAGHDSPVLNIDRTHMLVNAEVADNYFGGNRDAPSESSSAAASRTPGVQSFANVTSREKPVEPKTNETGKKGKKPTRVLLSTSGGRRY